MVQPSGNFREILKGVRLNFSLVIVLLVTISVLTMGAVLLLLNSETTLVKDPQNPAILREYPASTAFIRADDDAEEIATIINILQHEFRQDLREQLLLFTPVFVVISGILGYIVARYLVHPIRESYSAQERFIQDAAHELRNPLAAMKVSVQSNKGRPDMTISDMNDLLDSLERQVEQMVRINENLMILDRSQKSRPKEETNLTELLLDVIEDQQAKAFEAGIKIKHQTDDNVMYRIDPVEFVRLMRNLLENAIKYSGKDADEVRVSLRQKNNKIRLSVRDFGIGIPEEELHQVGQRFYRGSNTGDYQGTGLGMAIIQKVVRNNDGTLTIKSRPGEGTHVVVNF